MLMLGIEPSTFVYKIDILTTTPIVHYITLDMIQRNVPTATLDMSDWNVPTATLDMMEIGIPATEMW